MLFINYPTWIRPEIISGLPIRWYGLMYLFAFATSYIFIIHIIKKEKKELYLVPHITNMFYWIVIGVLVGGRIVSEVIYSRNPGMLLRPWLFFWPFDSNMRFVGIQGMSYHGGLLGGLLGGFFYCRKHHLKFWKVADKFFIGASLGYFFGRIGNFTNAELYGRITTSPLGMLFPYAEKLPYGDERVKAVADTLKIEPDVFGLVNLPRHPSQLYEAFFESLVVFAALYILYRLVINTKRYTPGMFVSLYIVGYGLARFFVEYFRQPDPQLGFIITFSKKPNPDWLFVSLFNFTMGQLLSLIMIISGLLLLILLKYINQRKKTIPIHK